MNTYTKMTKAELTKLLIERTEKLASANAVIFELKGMVSHLEQKINRMPVATETTVTVTSHLRTPAMELARQLAITRRTTVTVR